MVMNAYNPIQDLFLDTRRDCLYGLSSPSFPRNSRIDRLSCMASISPESLDKIKIRPEPQSCMFLETVFQEPFPSISVNGKRSESKNLVITESNRDIRACDPNAIIILMY